MMLEEIHSVVALQLGRTKVQATDRIVEDLGAESADVVNIVAALEDKFGITIGEAELQEVRTVSDLDDLVGARLK